MRGITRFSHWYHGQSGIDRAKKPDVAIESSLACSSIDDQSLDQTKQLIQATLKSSSNARHSLARFIYGSLINDSEVETLPDSEYRECGV